MARPSRRPEHDVDEDSSLVAQLDSYKIERTNGCDGILQARLGHLARRAAEESIHGGEFEQRGWWKVVVKSKDIMLIADCGLRAPTQDDALASSNRYIYRVFRAVILVIWMSIDRYPNTDYPKKRVNNATTNVQRKYH